MEKRSKLEASRQRKTSTLTKNLFCKSLSFSPTQCNLISSQVNDSASSVEIQVWIVLDKKEKETISVARVTIPVTSLFSSQGSHNTSHISQEWFPLSAVSEGDSNAEKDNALGGKIHLGLHYSFDESSEIGAFVSLKQKYDDLARVISISLSLQILIHSPLVVVHTLLEIVGRDSFSPQNKMPEKLRRLQRRLLAF